MNRGARPRRLIALWVLVLALIAPVGTLTLSTVPAAHAAVQVVLPPALARPVLAPPTSVAGHRHSPDPNIRGPAEDCDDPNAHALKQRRTTVIDARGLSPT